MSGDWRDHAACKGTDTELFFPGKDSILPPEAEALCAACPVATQCLEQALSYPEKYGVFAATTPDMRRSLRRSAQRKARREDGAAA